MNTLSRLVLLLISLFFTTMIHGTPVKIIFDTDMATDCDDVGAMAVLHTLADRGECDILATVTSVKDVDSIATVDAINRYRGRPDIPLGMVRGEGLQKKSRFVGKIAATFPHGVTGENTVPDAAEVYRHVLAKQPDHSVTIVTVGYLTNLKNLLKSPEGVDLVKTKVSRWVCMGGNFLGDPPQDDLSRDNVNFRHDASSAYYVMRHWPTEIVFAGREVCSVPSGLMIGESLANTPADNPVRRGYEHYFDGKSRNRHVADLASVLYAVRGLTDCWNISEPGAMNLKEDMSFTWRFDAGGKQRYLLKKPDNDRHVETVLEKLHVAPRKGGG